MKKTIMALALIVSVLAGLAMESYTLKLSEYDMSLADDTYNRLCDYHNAAAGSAEKMVDEDVAFEYIGIKTVCGQEKATEYYNAVISSTDLGDSFDKPAAMKLANKIVREYRAAIAAEQRPMPTPLPAPSLVPEGEYQIYLDVANDAWYAEAVNGMSSGGLLKGYDDGLFHPNDYITYAQWSVLMCRVAGVTDEGRDKGNHWAGGYYEEARSNGFVTMGGNLDEPISRGVALNGLQNGIRYDTVGFKDKLASRYTGKVWTLEDIPDHEIIKNNERQMDCGGNPDTLFWWADNIVQAYNWGITHGVDSAGTCNPLGGLTRAEAAQMLYNIGITREGSLNLGSSYIGSSSSGAGAK